MEQKLDTKDTNSNEIESNTLEWSKEIDILLAKWCDNAKCFEWMHSEASMDYSKKSKRFIVIINLLTALSGVSNIIVGGITVGNFQIAWIFGGISVITSSLNILQDKLGYQTLAESHRKYATQWTMIISKIEEIIVLPPSGRRDCKTFMRYIKNDINSATIDGNHIIPEVFRKACFNKFNNVANFDLPDICGHVEHTPSYLDDHVAININLSEVELSERLIKK
jgi:hypothetical protein